MHMYIEQEHSCRETRAWGTSHPFARFKANSPSGSGAGHAKVCVCVLGGGFVFYRSPSST